VVFDLVDAAVITIMSSITKDRSQRIESCATAVEQTQNDNTQSLRLIVATVAQMKAVQDDHGRQLGDHEVGGLRTEVNAVRRDLPTIVADVVRVVLREKR
jgi:hypothetical protein